MSEKPKAGPEPVAKPPWAYGCTNHGCMFGGPPGMGTNGPCYCNHPRSPEERARLRKNVTAALEAAREEGIRRALAQIPTNWCDPILTGEAKVFDRDKRPEPNVEGVLLAVRARIAALLPTPPEVAVAAPG